MLHVEKIYTAEVYYLLGGKKKENLEKGARERWERKEEEEKCADFALHKFYLLSRSLS